MEGYHRSVLLTEVLRALKVKKGGWYLDLTLGDGGYALEILKLGGKVVGVDVDPQALGRARKRLQSTGYSEQSWILIQGNFRDVKNLISRQTETRFEGVLFDLGVSSLQLMSPERGFSFSKSGPLDMRMDPNLQVRALDLVNGLHKGELYELFNKLGEEKNSRSLADALVRARALKPISTTGELAEIVERSVGRRGKIHPATKIFQALRIAINDELNALEEALDQVKEIVEKNGTILVISFHSLEDRTVKVSFKSWESLDLGEVLTKKPILPSSLETVENPRSRSAKMRVFRRS